MNDQDFRDLVALDAKGKADPKDSTSLRHRQNRERWFEALHWLKQDIESQMARRKAEFSVFSNQCWAMGRCGTEAFHKGQATYDSWRAGIIHFKTCIEKCLGEVKRARLEEERDEPTLLEHYKDLVEWACSLIPYSGDGVDWHDRRRSRVKA